MNCAKSLLILVAALIVALTAGIDNVVACPAAGELYDMRQPNGAVFQARTLGDEWTNWIEDADGRVIVKGNDGFWYYASGSSRAGIIASPQRVAIDGSPQRTIKAADLPALSQTVAIQRFLTPRSLQAQERVLVILVDFDDISVANPATLWSNYFFGTVGKTVRTYYRAVSLNQCNFVPVQERNGIPNDGIVRVHLNYNHPNPGENTTADSVPQLVRDALLAADASINFATYDTNHNNVLESDEMHVVVVAAGYDNAFGSNNTPSVYPHQYYLSSNIPNPDNVLVGDQSGGYVLIADRQGDHMSTIGVACHELGHSIGLPDLYDVTQESNPEHSSYGVGDHCLMGSGSWGKNGADLNLGQTPTHLCAWAKTKLGLITPAVVNASTQGNFDINCADSSNYNVLKYQPESSPSEYFLIENRRFPALGSAFDSGAYEGNNGDDGSRGGVLIWHIDESVIDANQLQNQVNTDNKSHKGVDLEQAQGSDEDSAGSEYNSDYFLQGERDLFCANSAPNGSKLYGGLESGLNIKINSAANDRMSVFIGPALDLTSPNGGEVWNSGTTKNIEWTYSGHPGSIKIEWVKQEGLTTSTGIITEQTEEGSNGTGSIAWSIPNDLFGDKIKIRMTSTVNTTVTESSNNFFTISPLHVTSPNGNEEWLKGSNHTISWTYGGQPDLTVKIDLINGETLDRNIASLVSIGSAGSGSYDWTVPDDLTQDGFYKIRVTCTLNAAYTDTSDEFFHVKSLIITQPNGGESWIGGSTQTIKWTYAGNPDCQINLNLIKANPLTITSIAACPIGAGGQGTYDWIVPDNLPAGGDYIISVGCEQQPDYQDASAPFTINPAPTGPTKIVLTWSANPSDLDSHLTGPTPDGARFHVCYYDQVYSSSGVKYVDLDIDDTSSYGPETTTIYQQIPGVYRFSVHDYTNRSSTSSTALGNSGARVQLYRGSSLIATYDVPANQPGTTWTVFELNGNTITPINQMSYGSVSSLRETTAEDDSALFMNLPPK